MKLSQITDSIQWDFTPENEFTRPDRKTGYSFVIDGQEDKPLLVLYRMGPYSSHTSPLDRQPPPELIQRALRSYRKSPTWDGLYPINEELRNWIRKNLFNE